MIHIQHIDHIVLRVTDLDAMISFYGHVLGCPVERRNDELGLIQLRAGSCLIDLVPVSGKLGSSGGAAPGNRAAILIISASGSNPSNRKPFSSTLLRMA